MGDEQSQETKNAEQEELEKQEIGNLYQVFNEEAMKKQKTPDLYANKGKLEQSGMENFSKVVAKLERKPIKLMKVKDLQTLDQHEKNKAKFEDRALMCLGHPYIIQIYQAFTRDNGNHHVVCEFCEGRDFLNFLKMDSWVPNEVTQSLEFKPQSQDTILTWFTQVALALEETHSQELTHRNFCSSHVFRRKRTVNGKEVVTAILGNFGNTKAQKVAAKTIATMTMGGDVYYTSPENLCQIEAGKKKETARLVLGKKSDVWALGVFLHEMCTGQRLEGTSPDQDADHAFAGNKQKPEQIAQMKAGFPILGALIEQICVEEKEKRPFASGVLQLPGVKEKVKEIVSDPVFVEEFKRLTLRKITLGWARPGEVIRAKQMMKEKGTKDPKDIIEEFTQHYQRRVIEGGEYAIDCTADADINIAAEDGDWGKQEERFTDQVKQ